MANLEFDEDDDDHAIDENEYPDDDEADWNLDPAQTKCPHCGGDIVEDSQQCPHCGKYISLEDSPRKTNVLSLVVIAALIILLAFGFFWLW